jgi:hypothetical protein
MARALIGFAGSSLEGEESGPAEDVQSDPILVEQIVGGDVGLLRRLGERVNARLTRSAAATTAFLQ